MEEPVTDADDYTRHRQIVLADDVTPISRSVSSSSSITPLSPTSLNDGSAVQKVSPTSMLSTPKFTLPKGWSVEKVRRRVGGTIDKYYFDPESGRQFRSLKEVERFVTEGVTPSKYRTQKINNHEKKSSSQDRSVSDEEMLDSDDDKDKNNEYQLANVSFTTPISADSSKLPDGWIVEEVPRRTGGYADKYYYEPGTGQRFRSLVAVHKHLEELQENSPLSVVLEEMRENLLPLSKAFKLNSRIKDHGSYSSWKKSISIVKEEKIENPPSKINWVISDGDAWNAYVDDTLVPDSMKQQWGNTFMMEIKNTKRNAPPVSGS